ncbi:MAG: Ig-like domain-containing protein [Gemmatimonadales bacterium]
MSSRIRRTALTTCLLATAVVLSSCAGATDPVVPPPPPPPPPPPAVTGVTVTASAATVEVGSTLQATAAVAPSAAAQQVTWSTSNAGRATVSSSGLVTGVTPGTVTITATSVADPTRSGSLPLTVTGCSPLVQADVANGATLAAGSCHRAMSALSVSGGTLTVGPGARIEFGPSSALTITSGGRLNAVGTPTQPILFTSVDPAGEWRGVLFANSRSNDNVLRYVTIQHGGSAPWTGDPRSQAALNLDGNTLVDIQNTTIDGSGAQGVLIDAGVEMTFENNRIHSTVIPIWVHPNAVQQIGSSTLLGGTQGSNVEHIVRVGFGNTDAVTVNQTWPHLVAAYEIQHRMAVRAELTIEQGTIVMFAQDVSMIVEPTGSLTAVGERGPGTEILFTNAGRIDANIPGFWKGIQIQSASPRNRFEYVTIENGGSQLWTGNTDSRAMVYLDGNSRALFRGTRFEGSAHYGLWVPAGGDISGFEDNSFVNNARAMIVHPNRAGAIASSNLFGGTGENRVRVSFGNTDALVTAQTWRDFGTPFYVAVRTSVDAPLTIEAGTTIEFAADASLQVGEEGSLRAIGTVTDPIRFLGGENVPGYWSGIEYGSTAGANRLEHVLFRSAGSSQWFGGGNAAAALHVNGDGFVALQNVQFQQLVGYAAIVRNGGAMTCNAVDDGGFMFRLWQGSALAVFPSC